MRFKRTLTATTALMAAGFLATAAPTPAEANMEVTLDGMSRFMLQYAEDDRLSGGSDPSYNFEFEARPNIRVRAETDTGIVYGGRVEFQAATWDTRNVRRAMLFIDGAFGRIEMGNDEGAARTMVLSPLTIARGSGGTDGLFVSLVRGTKLADGDRPAKVTYYTPRVAGFQLGGSFTPNTNSYTTRRPNDDEFGLFRNQFEVGANYVGEFGGVDLGLSAVGVYGRSSRTSARIPGNTDVDYSNRRSWEVAGRAGFMGARFAASYAHERPGLTAASQGLDARDRIIQLGASYAIGPVGVGASFITRRPRGGDREDVYVGSADYALFPGMRLQGDVAYNRSRSPAVDNFWSGVAVVRLDF